MTLLNVVIESVFSPRANLNAIQSPKDVGVQIPGVGPLTLIETDFGLVPAQALRVRDRVRLRSGLFCPIACIDRLMLDEAFLERHPGAQPVLIEPGTVDDVVPREPILLAPGQKLSGQKGLRQTSRTAYALCRDGVARRHPEQIITYVVFSFPKPEDVCSSGLWLHVEPTPGSDE